MRKAVLSRFLLQHLLDLVEAHKTPLDQTCDHPHMFDNRHHADSFGHLGLQGHGVAIPVRDHQIALAVQGAFLLSPLFRAVVGLAASRGLLAAMTLAAPKGTA